MKEWCDSKYWEKGIENFAGVDEAGRGPLAGPVVAAAVILPKYLFIEGLFDSKKMNPNERERIYSIIQKKASGIGVGEIGVAEIDRINILQATLTAMNTAVNELPFPPGMILVDGNRTPEWNRKSEAIIKGDNICHAIAAASVIAKVTRDRIMKNLDDHYPQYQFAKNKGYGTKAHIEAIKKHGLSPVHRRTFCRKFIEADVQSSISWRSSG